MGDVPDVRVSRCNFSLVVASVFTSLGFRWLVGLGLPFFGCSYGWASRVSCLLCFLRHWVWHPDLATLGFGARQAGSEFLWAWLRASLRFFGFGLRTSLPS